MILVLETSNRTPIFLGNFSRASTSFFLDGNTGCLNWQTSFFIAWELRCFRTSFDFWAVHFGICAFRKRDFTEKDPTWSINTNINWINFVSLTRTSGNVGTQIETSLSVCETSRFTRENNWSPWHFGGTSEALST